MRRGLKEGRKLDDYFGDQSGYFKHSLVLAARHCHAVLAVGPQVVDELRFMSPDFSQTDVRVAYNGIPSRATSLGEIDTSKQKLRRYANELLGWSPDFIFTHVTRLVRSKGLWRDLWVMEEVDRQLQRENRTAVLLVLSTEIGGPRRSEEILQM